MIQPVPTRPPRFLQISYIVGALSAGASPMRGTPRLA